MVKTKKKRLCTFVLGIENIRGGRKNIRLYHE